MNCILLYLSVKVEKIKKKYDLNIKTNTDLIISQARYIILYKHRYSISYLQRKLDIGYNRASILMGKIQPKASLYKKKRDRRFSRKKHLTKPWN